MDFSIPADTGDPVTGAVAFVHFQQFQDLCRPPGILFLQSQVDVWPVGMVIHGQDFLFQTPRKKILCPVHDEIQKRPRLVMGKVFPDQL